jgi:hypothetical protein
LDDETKIKTLNTGKRMDSPTAARRPRLACFANDIYNESMAGGDAALNILRTPEKYDKLRVNAWNRSKTFAWNQVVPPVCDWLEQQAAKKSK